MKTRHITPTAVNGIEAQAFDLSVGDIVELRNGLHMYIDVLDAKGDYPILGHKEEEVIEQFANWTATGSYYENEISLYDIVALHKKAPKDYTTLPVGTVPFEIDPVKGRHCFVWDDDKRQGKYAVVIYISDDSEFPYVTTGSVNYKHAEPAYP